ncbi:uncharacterized protein LOC117151125 [Bombus impatiens]|uniref:Uncharacterized protein LOC117151125 n=1 Tax=Bombus impatiens TaxID=132113 RepID=A0A6P8L856_BOMIM|nr:uncharacterized protein LOC117151125 [Bombus impatiens]
MKKTWSVGERIFKQDYKRGMKMFGALVESVALFGAKVWGWNMEERLDRVQRGYVKWILGLDMTTPNYILVEVCKLIEMKEKALKRAARYEEKALESKKELVKECIKEREREWGNGQEGKRARKRKKGLEELRKGGTQIETREE